MLTSDDLIQVQRVIHAEIQSLEKRLAERIDKAQMEIIEVVDKNKADSGVVTELAKRVDRLEDHAGLPPYPAQ